MTILSDGLCKEIGNVAADNLGNEQVVNHRKELCGAFVNKMNVTFVNYTLKIAKKEDNNKLGDDFFLNKQLYLFSYEFTKIDFLKEVKKKQRADTDMGMFRLTNLTKFA